MAALRPASRLLSRQLTRITSTSSSSSTTSIHTPRTKSLHRSIPTTTTQRTRPFHTTRTLLREDQETFTSTGRRPGTPTADRIPPKDPRSNDAYPDGAPGEPKPGESLPSGIAPSTLYTFEDIASISSNPSAHTDKLLIDVREPSELLQTGRIPGAVNVPVGSAPDAFFLSAEDFEDKYGFAKPGPDQEVIFYCKAGVRSKAAARLAGQAGFGGKAGEFPGSWLEWEKNGGEVQKE